jgi:hypothetical protein
MKTKIFKLMFVLCLGLFAFSPLQYASAGLNVAHAQTSDCGDPSLHRTENNLCLPTNQKSVGPNSLLLRVINLILGISFLVAVLFVVIGGFRYIVSAGNDDQAKAGRKTVINAVIGIVLIVLAYVIVSAVSRAASSDCKSGYNTCVN